MDVTTSVHCHWPGRQAEGTENSSLDKGATQGRKKSVVERRGVTATG